MRLVIAWILSGISTTCVAGVYKLDLTYSQIVHNNDALVPDVPTDQWGQQVQLELGIREPLGFFLEPNVHFETAYQKVETVGLQFRTGFFLTNWLDVEWQHHSRHSADRTNSYGEAHPGVSTKYPLFDAAGVRIHFIP